MNNLLADFRSKLQSGKCVYGPFMKTADPMFVEATGIAGFDFAILDMEHGPVSLQDQQNNIRAAELRNLFPIIRVSELSEHAISSALEMGALGIQVPQIQSAAQAREVVKYAKFYPYGMRGVCRFVRAAEYTGLDRKEYFEASRDIVLIVHLEGMEAVRNLDEILDVEDIDILFIGPYDLSQSLGIPGEVNNPIVIDEMKKIVELAKSKGKVIGTFVDDIDTLKLWRDAGIQYLSYNVDIGMYIDACKNVIERIK